MSANSLLVQSNYGLGIKGSKFLDNIYDYKFEVLQGTWLLQGNLTNFNQYPMRASDSYMHAL
jgi:hypothetical protein